MSVQKLVFASAFCALCLSACGTKDGENGADAVATRIHVETLSGEQKFECAHNGKRIFVYKDANNDGKLSPGEEITKERTLDCPTVDQ